jgi:hypothetical protein
MRSDRTEYLFSVNTHTPPTMTVDSGEEFTVEVRGAFDDEDISAVPTPFTPGLRRTFFGADDRADCRARRETRDAVAIDFIELTPFGIGR